MKYSVLSATACLIAGGVVASLPDAQAGTTLHIVPPLPSGNHLLRSVALAHSRLPKGAQLATHGLPPLGSNGPAFEAPAKPATSSTARVAFGYPANSSDYPWVVGVESEFLAPDDTGTVRQWILICSGTVISPTKVLTAGQCTADLPAGDTEVIAGRNTLPQNFVDDGSGGFVDGVASTWIDPDYNLKALRDGTGQVPVDDVAVLTLRTPLPSAYPAVVLSSQDDQTPYGEGISARIVGYGKYGTGSADDLAGTLRTDPIPFASDANCTTRFGSLYDPTRMVCAGGFNGGIDACPGDAGGPLLDGDIEVAITDWGQSPCGDTYSVYERLSRYHDVVAADRARPSIVNLDFTGDGHTDLLARDGSGTLHLYGGSGFTAGGFPAFNIWGPVNGGWNVYNKLFRVTNWNGDHRESIMAETAGGALYRYDLDPAGNILPRVLIGSGWGVFTDIMVTNDWNGDGLPNLLARTKGGDLWIYNSNGHGGWNNPSGTRIGTGWGAFNTVLTPGDWSGDGHQALLGRTPIGDLFLYESDGHGGWSNGGGTRIGTGWGAFSTFMSPGDVNGDDMMDVIGVTPGGLMFLYTTDGGGRWITGIGEQIGSGWNMFNRIF
jgi:hypothetical protein